MIDQRQDFDFGGCVVWLVENGTFALGMLLLFSKTVDLMTAWAPSTLFGYTGMETAYGLAVGFLVEGALFVMKLTLPRSKNVMDWLWTVLVVVLPFLVSALAQIFDSFQVRQTFTQQPLWIQTFVTYFVPSVPTLIIALLIGKSIFSSMPAEIMPAGASALKVPSSSAPRPPAGAFRGRFVFKLPGWLRGKNPKIQGPPLEQEARPVNPSLAVPAPRKLPPR